MPRGQVAKETVSQKIISTFGNDYAGTYDKKIYVWAVENGERIQVALSLTCPKEPIVFGEKAPNTDINGDWDFSGAVKENNVVINAPPPEISSEEIDNLAKLLEKYGL